MTAPVEGEFAEVADDLGGRVGVPASRRSPSIRDRLIDAAVAITTDHGWAGVTMSKVAMRAGVARQTVYHEVGNKNGLAEAMVLREVERFLHCVERAFDAHSEDLLEAIRTAVYDVLDRAQGNLLLHAVVGATHGANTELLPYLSTHSEGLLDLSRQLVGAQVARYEVGLDQDRVDLVVDMVVRSVLSSVMQPSRTPQEVADGIVWIVERVLPVTPVVVPLAE